MILATKMEHFNGPIQTILSGRTAEEIVAEKERKAMGPPLLMAPTKDHLAKKIIHVAPQLILGGLEQFDDLTLKKWTVVAWGYDLNDE
ncbi:hypothetical protein Tco_0547667 [Tanacetum coccineum]